MPVSAWEQPFNLPYDVATSINIQYYSDLEDASEKFMRGS